MQAPPVFSFHVTCFSAWRALVCVGGVVVTVAAAVWAVQQGASRPWASLLVPAVWPLCWTAWRAGRRFHLRWDGAAWHLAAGPGGFECQGSLRVVADAGSWMLCSFVPEVTGDRRWLPVQQRGHEAAWHGFRLTVYGAPDRFARLAAPDL